MMAFRLYWGGALGGPAGQEYQDDRALCRGTESFSQVTLIQGRDDYTATWVAYSLRPLFPSSEIKRFYLTGPLCRPAGHLWAGECQQWVSCWRLIKAWWWFACSRVIGWANGRRSHRDERGCQTGSKLWTMFCTRIRNDKHCRVNLGEEVGLGILYFYYLPQAQMVFFAQQENQQKNKQNCGREERQAKLSFFQSAPFHQRTYFSFHPYEQELHIQRTGHAF